MPLIVSTAAEPGKLYLMQDQDHYEQFMPADVEVRVNRNNNLHWWSRSQYGGCYPVQPSYIDTYVPAGHYGSFNLDPQEVQDEPVDIDEDRFMEILNA